MIRDPHAQMGDLLQERSPFIGGRYRLPSYKPALKSYAAALPILVRIGTVASKAIVQQMHPVKGHADGLCTRDDLVQGGIIDVVVPVDDSFIRLGAPESSNQGWVIKSKASLTLVLVLNGTREQRKISFGIEYDGV